MTRRLWRDHQLRGRLIFLKSELIMEGILLDDANEAQPQISDFKGNRILRIPIVVNALPDLPSQWLSFGKTKAKAIVKHFDAIKKFAEGENE